MSVAGSIVDAVVAASHRFGELDGRYLLPALVLQLLTLVFRSLAWRGVLVAAYPGHRIPFLGQLPGDFLFRRENTTIYIPLATSLVLSLLISLLLNIFWR